MNTYLLLLPILLPILGGACLPAFRFKNRKHRQAYVGSIVCINTVLLFWMMITGIEGVCTPLQLSDMLELKFHMDGFSKVFAGLVALLWPMATLYAFEYMKHEGRENLFFSFYTMTYGVTVGITFAGNLITLYMFYELLTLSTLTLVMHSLDKKSILAGRKYMVYSIAGAAFAFMGLMFLLFYGTTTDFVFGGVLDISKVGANTNLLLFAFVMTALGFGVKAAIFPFHGWLPTASVAPTPVTALLHAVAVVKAGAFAIMRITYYSFGMDFLQGSWGQYTVMTFAIVTIVFGSSMAVKETHLKRRLAYSTVSNLSYIVLGTMMISPAGFVGGMSHMIMHGIMKITLFFCVGAIMHQTHKEYIKDIGGIAKSMPVVMACFTVGSIAVVGVPPLCGFVSKWYLATAAFKEGSGFAMAGAIALLISAFLTAIYLFSIVIKAYFETPLVEKIVCEELDECAGHQEIAATYEGVKTFKKQDPNWYMKAPLIVLCMIMAVLGLCSGPLIHFFEQIAQGLL